MDNKNIANFMIEYIDDLHRKHLTFVKSFSEVKFYKERFDGRVKFEPISREVKEDAATGHIGTFLS